MSARAIVSHSEEEEEEEAAAVSRVSSARVSMEGRRGSTGEDRHSSNCLGEVRSSGQQQPYFFKKK